MNRQTKKSFSVLLVLVMLAAMWIPSIAAAGDPICTLTLSPSEISTADGGSTIVATLSLDRAADMCNFGYHVTYDSDVLELKEIAGDGSNINITSGDINLLKGRVSWTTDDVENISGQILGKFTFETKADLSAGTSTIKVEEITVGKNYGTIAVVEDITASADLTITAVHEHTYGEPVYEWSEDGKSCRATVSCTAGDDTITENAVIQKNIVKQPTTDEVGEASCTATFKNPLFEVQTKTGIVIPKIAAYEMYMQPISGEKGETYSVTAGSTVPVGLYIVSSADKELETFEATIEEDSNLNMGSVELSQFSLSYDTTSDGKLFIARTLTSGTVALQANTPVLLATINYVVPETVDAGSSFDISIRDTAQIGTKDKTTKDSPVLTKATLSIADQFTTTFVDKDGNTVGTIIYNAGDSPFADPEVPEAPAGYENGRWEEHSNTPDNDQTVRPVYDPIEYDLTFVDEEGNPVGDSVIHTVETYSDDVVLPDVPEKPGYNGAWNPDDLAKIDEPGELTVHPVYTPIEYLITYSGDDVPTNITQKYTAESTDTLNASVTRANYRLAGWTVKADSGSWKADGSVLPLDTAVTGMYGNVTLQAVWELNPQYAVEDYRYANSSDVLLIVNDTLGAGKAFAYNGNTMFHTTDSEYFVNKDGDPYFEGEVTGVYVYIVNCKDDIASNISITTDTPVEIQRNGDVNLQNGLDIQDSNVVYQMLIQGDRYSNEQLGVRERLEADVMTSQEDASYRGSIRDAKEILDRYYETIH